MEDGIRRGRTRDGVLRMITRRRVLISGSAAIPLSRPAIGKLLWQGGGGGAAASPGLPAISSIGTAPGRTFSTWDAWLAAVVALGKVRIGTYPNGVTGVGYPDSEFTPASLVIGNVDTSDFDGTGTFAITLTAAPGSGVQRGVPLAYNGNAATYNPANGVCLKFNLAPNTYPFDGGIVINRQLASPSSNVLIQNLQLKLIAGNRVIDTDNNLPPTTTSQVVVQNCIVESMFGTGVYTGGCTKCINCLFLFRGYQDPCFIPHAGVFDGPAGTGAHFYGCTVVAVSDDTGNPLLCTDALTSLTWSGGTVSATSSVPHGFAVGRTLTIVVVSASPSGYNGTFSGTITGASTFTYPLATNPGVMTAPGSWNTPAIYQPQNAWTNTGGEGGGTAVTTWHDSVFFGFDQPSNVAPLNTAYANCLTNSIYTQSEVGITGGVSYGTSTFVGTTSVAADFRIPSGSPLINAGMADATYLTTDITGLSRPPSGAIDAGCYQFTVQPLLVNGSGAPAPVVAGDGMHVQANNIPSGTSIRVTLENSSGVWNSVPSSGYIAYGGPTVDVDMKISEYNPTSGQNVPLGLSSAVVPGTYFVRLYYSSAPSTVQQQVSVLINSFIPYPFAQFNTQVEANLGGILTLSTGVTGSGVVLGGATSGSGVLAVKGNISVSTGFVGGAGGFSPTPTNVTIQFYAVDGSLTYHPIGNSPSTAPIFNSSGVPSITSFDTTTLADGSYIIWAKIVDMADTSGQHWTANIFGVTPVPLIIQNGVSAMSPTGTYMIPTSYTGTNRRFGSSTPDAIHYKGVPIANNSLPYPSDSVVGNYTLPVYNSSSPFNADPTTARAPTLGFWFQGADGIRTNEYRNPMRFSQTTGGGIFTQRWFAKTTGALGIESAYQAVAAGSYSDGPRNSNQTTNFTTVITTPSTGPWSAYHWTFIQEDGRLGVMNLAGAKVTIAGPKLDPTKLQHDWEDFTGNPEFPDSIQVGTIDTNPMFTFGDFGGAAADCCWDPRDPYICYVSQTIDHCIIKINFHTQTISGVNYGPSNPLCQRYAGYKGGLTNAINSFLGQPGGPLGGYANGPALGSVNGGVQRNASFTGSISGTTLTVSGVTGTIAAGQCVSALSGNVTPNTFIVSGGGTTWTIAPSQTVSSQAMFTVDGAQFNGIYSITMQHRTDNSTYPRGTMFVCDNYNSVVRMISAAPIDSNGNFTGAGPTVTTLVGTHSGAIPDPTAAHGPLDFWNTNINTASATINVVSMTDNGDGTAHVILAGTPTSPVSSVGWKVFVLVSGSYYKTGGPTFENSLGKYTVSSWTSSTNFNLTINPVPTGTLSVFIGTADIYSSPQPVSFANAYTLYPTTIRMTSAGDIVYGESWYNMMCRRIWLNNNPNTPSSNWSTITRLLPFGNNAISVNLTGNVNPSEFGWFDIDNPLIDPAVGSVAVGACGPIDDIVSFMSDSDPGSAANAFRFSLDLSYNSGGTSFSAGNWFGDGGPDFPSEGTGGVGHYPWGFCFSNTAFRMLSLGLDPTGWFQWRPAYAGDPAPFSVDAVGGVGDEPFFYPYEWLDSGWMLCQQGTRQILPVGFRPALSALLGASGLHQYGANTGPTLDDLPVLYPSNTSLGAYIQGGLFGSVPRPELGFDDDGVTPSRPLAALMYYIRRQSLSGSWPSQQAPLFNLAIQSLRDGSGQMIAPGQWSLNYIRPNITITSPGGVPQRTGPTSIRVQWTTDKNTLGIVIAGTPNSNVTNIFGKFLYNFWTTLEMDNSAVWGMTHDVTLTGLPANNVTPPAGSNAPNNVAVLVIDRAGNWNLSPNFSVS